MPIEQIYAIVLCASPFATFLGLVIGFELAERRKSKKEGAIIA